MEEAAQGEFPSLGLHKNSWRWHSVLGLDKVGSAHSLDSDLGVLETSSLKGSVILWKAMRREGIQLVSLLPHTNCQPRS